MALQCGIVGLPNVGKSTLFNALTRAGIAAENYPFCTIEPNVGVVEVPDPRLAKLSEIVKPERVVPAVVEFVDIAGLVAGASQGEGLGNQFLSHIRETDAIVNVVRCFEDDNVVHVAGKVDPISDIEVIATELALADLQIIEKAIHRNNKLARSGDKDAAKLVALLERCQQHLDGGQPIRSLGLDKEELFALKSFGFITAKPAMFVANVSDQGFEGNPLLARLTEYAQAQNAPVIAICAAIEAEIAELNDEDRAVFLDDGRTWPGPSDSRRLQTAGPANLLHRRRQGSARLDHPGRCHRPPGRRRHPHRFRTRLHPRANDFVRGFSGLQGRSGCEGSGADAF